MKLQLKYFLALSILLGAIGVPWAWRTYQARRAAEIERLESEATKRKALHDASKAKAGRPEPLNCFPDVQVDPATVERALESLIGPATGTIPKSPL